MRFSDSFGSIKFYQNIPLFNSLNLDNFVAKSMSIEITKATSTYCSITEGFWVLLQYPVYFAYEDENLQSILKEVAANDAAGRPATAMTGGYVEGPCSIC